MSATKRWLEEISVELGYGGEINDTVLSVAEEIQAEARAAPMMRRHEKQVERGHKQKRRKIA